jgi:hypothetical protein
VIAHVLGLPIEESVLQLAPAGAAMVTAVAIAGRESLGRLRGRRPDGQILPSDCPPRPTCNPKTTHEGGRDEFRPDRS